MSGRIITTYEGKKHDGNGFLHLDFDSIQKESIKLQFEVSGIPNNKEIIWEVYSNNEQLDVNDLTRGRKAEFIMLKTYAGSNDNPHIFIIVVRDTNGTLLGRLDISVYAKPKITNAFWGSDTDNKIHRATINHQFTAFFIGEGLFNTPLNIKFFLQSSDDNDLEITDFERIIRMTSNYDLEQYCLDRKTFQDNYQFFLRNTPTILLDFVSGNSRLAVTGDVKETAIAKAYFIISYNNEILFNGKDKKQVLDLVFNISSFTPPPPSQTIKPVVVYSEQYFTQKYEPCKYEKIFYKHGNNNELEAFDEKKPTQKNPDGSFKNSKIIVSCIVPPRGSNNIKELKIRLENVETKDCSFLDTNKSKTKFSDDSSKKENQPHKGRVIDTVALDEAKIEYSFEKPDEIINVKPSFNYQYDKSQAWDFMKNYFLFSSMLRNTDVIENQFKGILMGWEMESKKLIDVHTIGLETCRYNKALHLKTYADVAWAFHALFDDPYIPEYYIYGNQKTIKTVKGLDAEIDWLKNNSMVDLFSAPILGSAIGSNFVRDFILDIIKDIAERYEFGFTAYYDFDDKGKKNSEQIDYAETHPNVFKALIAGVVTLEILIDVLLIILTEGAALANFISKAGKVAGVVNKGTKVVNAGKKATDILAKHSQTFEIARNANMAKNTFELMKGSYFKGYRFVDDQDIGVQPVLEERVKISPFLNVGVSQKKKLGELLLDKTHVGMTLNMAKAATGGFGLGISRMFLSKIKVKGKDVGKQGVGWYLAATYPLKIANYIISGTYDLLAFATDEALKVVFGAEAEFEKDITAHIDLDFWLKIQNAEKKLDILAIAKGQSKTDKSSISIAPSGAFTVRLKLSGSVSNKVVVRAMNVLTWNNRETGMQEMNTGGKFEVEGNVFIEKRFYFKADGKPYHEDKIAFTGLAGEYEYKIKKEKNPRANKSKSIIKEQEPKQFMLMEPCQLVFHSTEMTKHPAEDK